MGSRVRHDVNHFFECFCEVVGPKTSDDKAWIIQKFPESYNDDSVLKSVPQFAFPCEFDRSVTQHYSFVLTNVDSKWTFGFCRHDPKSETSLVVLTYLPWHDVFNRFLDYLCNLTEGSHSDHLWRFLDIVYQSKVPRTGYDLTITPHSSVTPFHCEAPSEFKLPSIPEDRNLTEYYNAVDNNIMMTVFASMLYERRIIFTSKRLSRLSACVLSANCLLYPMMWQHIFIPVLPRTLIDYLLAPMPYLIGLPHSLLQDVRWRDIGDVVVLDADNFAIETPFRDLQSLPTDLANNLQKQLNRPTMLGDSVSRAFLRAIVQLIGGYRDALKINQGKKITFDAESFVESRPSSMQPFLRKMLELQIFQQFIEERLELLNAGLGFSDEFELEVCNYLDKSNSKLQQYREWVNTMKRESSALIKTVKNRANPAMKSAVKTVKERGKNVKSAYKGIRSKLKDNKREEKDSPTKSGAECTQFYVTPDSTLNPDSTFQFSDNASNNKKGFNFDTLEDSNDELSPIDMDLMGDLRDVIFRNYYTTTPNVDGNAHCNENGHSSVGKKLEETFIEPGNSSNTSSALSQPVSSSKMEIKDLIRLDSMSSISEFDPLNKKEEEVVTQPPIGLTNPLYSYYYANNNPSELNSNNNNNYELDLTSLSIKLNKNNEDESVRNNEKQTSRNQWTKFDG